MLQQFLFVRSGLSINWDNLIGWCSFKMMRDTSPSFWFYAASMQLFANFTNWEFGCGKMTLLRLGDLGLQL